MKILIIGFVLFPFGTASGARVRNLALGLKHQGADVHILVTAPMKIPENPMSGHYTYQGITYEILSPWNGEQGFSGNQPSFSRKLVYRFIDKVRWFFSAYKSAFLIPLKVITRYQIKELDCIIVYDRSFVRSIFVLLFSKILGIAILLDAVELPNYFLGWGGRL